MDPTHRLLLCMTRGLRFGAIHELFSVVRELRFLFVGGRAGNDDDWPIAATHGVRAQLKAKASIFEKMAIGN